MSSFGLHNTALAYIHEDQMSYERETFFKALFHDDRESFYFLSTFTDGVWVDSGLKASTILAKGEFPKTNCYVTRNGYNSKSERSGQRIRQFNSFLFDLDCHGVSVEDRDSATDAILGKIYDGVSQGFLPMPTLIVDSGRGVQVYYVFHRSIPYRFVGKGEINEKGVRFYKDVYRQLASVFEELMEDLQYVDVDRRVFDDARVGRIPGTYNTKAERYARLVYASELYHHLADLASYKPISAAIAAIPKHLPVSKPKSGVIIKFNHMLMSRLNKVVELQKYRQYDCEGSRELMSFVFYNTAVQLYSRKDAKERLGYFNARFSKPLPEAELNGIVRSVDSVVNVKGETGHYVIKASTLVELLALTEKEMTDLNFFASKRMTERLEAKRRTKEKRNNRNERIIGLCEAGTLTQLQIAEAVGCSLRTVQSVLKQAGLTQRRARAAAPENKRWVAGTERRILRFLQCAKNWRPCFSGSDMEDTNEGLNRFFELKGLISPAPTKCLAFGHRLPLSSSRRAFTFIADMSDFPRVLFKSVESHRFLFMPVMDG